MLYLESEAYGWSQTRCLVVMLSFDVLFRNFTVFSPHIHINCPQKSGSVIVDSGSDTNLMEVVEADETDGESANDAEASNDSEYNASEVEDEDDSTIAEQELHEREVDHADELNTLHKEGACVYM